MNFRNFSFFICVEVSFCYNLRLIKFIILETNIRGIRTLFKRNGIIFVKGNFIYLQKQKRSKPKIKKSCSPQNITWLIN